jgi:hypothetical protein
MDLDECTCNQCNNHIDWNNPLHLVAIGKAIKFCRQISGITIDALADNSLDSNRIIRIEEGHGLSMHHFDNIAYSLDMPRQEIIDTAMAILDQNNKIHEGIAALDRMIAIANERKERKGIK